MTLKVNENLKKCFLVGGLQSCGMKMRLKFRDGILVLIKPDIDLQVGKALTVTFLIRPNTRAINFRGGLGDKPNFRQPCLKVRSLCGLFQQIC
jgi:hypothetical protein